jgi:hypothetical protein
VGQNEGSALSREAKRLLRALAPEDSYAMADPIAARRVIVRASRGGVSVGGGRFAAAAVEELLRHDLAVAGALGEKRVVRISQAGTAHLRRDDAASDVAYLAQHQDLVRGRVEIEGEKIAVTIDAVESPLDWLRRRKDRGGEPFLDEASYQAGERLRRDLTLALMLPRVTANWNAAVSDRGRTMRDPAGASDAAVAARQRVRRALDAVGPDFADLLIDLCGFLKGLETIERERRWPARSGKIVAKLALARLAEHYGLQRSAQGPARSRGIQAWRAVVLGEEARL